LRIPAGLVGGIIALIVKDLKKYLARKRCCNNISLQTLKQNQKK
jgi:hypothetical protein